MNVIITHSNQLLIYDFILPDNFTTTKNTFNHSTSSDISLTPSIVVNDREHLLQYVMNVIYHSIHSTNKSALLKDERIIGIKLRRINF